jgi:hypothetical protein
VLVLGLLAAAVFDPAAEGCAQCPRNLLLVDGGSGIYQSLNQAGLYLGLACSLLLILLAAAGLIRSAPAGRRLAAPVVATRLGPGLDAALTQRINQAEAELRAALADLRELAQGIFPAMLAEEGLATAIEALAEAAPVPLAITALPGERFGASVEAAAYFVVAETVRQNATGVLRVCAARRDGRLVVEVAGDSAPGSMTELEDRVGALGGSVMTVPGPAGRAMIRAEIPCES